MFFTGLLMVSGLARLNPPKPAVDFPADVPTLAATSFVEETEYASEVAAVTAAVSEVAL